MGKVLVTGGAGYIGSHVVHALADRGWSPVVIDNLSTGFKDAIPASVALEVGDVGDVLFVGDVIRRYACQAALHFAGSIVVPESVTNPLKYYGNNVSASLNLISACHTHGITKIIFSSTAAVYGAADVVPVSEVSPVKPTNPYGWSKLMTEQMLMDTSAATALRYVALRYFNVAGADGALRTGQRSRNATHLIKVALEAALGRRENVTVFGNDYATPDGTGVRDYIHVSDLAAAHLSALDYLMAGGSSEVLNCGYGHGFSVREVLAAVERVAQVKLNVATGPRRHGDVGELVSDSRRLRQLLDWRPEHDDLDHIVASALAWERKLA